MTALVSIVIPCYDVETCVAEAIESALSQRYPAVDIICVDNGSQDGTLDILKEYEASGSIRILHEARKGAPAARNTGWRAAQGEWIQFLDADDLIGPEKLAHQMALLAQEEKSPPFIAAACMKQDMDAGEGSPWEVKEPVWHGLLMNRLGNTCANLFRKCALVGVGGWDESLKSSQEYDLMFRIMAMDDGVLIDRDVEHTVIRIRSEGSISSADRWGNQQRFLALLARICRYLKAHRPEEYDRLPSDWFQEVYQRIRLNTIHGQTGSDAFYKDILPAGFKPVLRPYDGRWFLMLEKVVGPACALAAEEWIRARLRLSN